MIFQLWRLAQAVHEPHHLLVQYWPQLCHLDLLRLNQGAILWAQLHLLLRRNQYFIQHGVLNGVDLITENLGQVRSYHFEFQSLLIVGSVMPIAVVTIAIEHKSRNTPFYLALPHGVIALNHNFSQLK